MSYPPSRLGTVTPPPAPSHPGATDPPAVLSATPSRVMSAVSRNPSVEGCVPACAAELLMVDANATLTLTSTNIMTFMMMSR